MIELRNVVRRFPQSDKPVLDGVNLKLERGEFAFLTGVSGAGKSTLLRLLYGADQATSGEVRVAGHDVDQLTSHSLALLRRRVAVIFQDFRLLNGRTAQVLLCDEPTGNLDDQLSLNVLSLIDLASARGATVLVATHARELLTRFPHPSYRLVDGHLEQRR